MRHVLVLFMALGAVACAHHPTYVAPGDREPTETQTAQVAPKVPAPAPTCPTPTPAVVDKDLIELHAVGARMDGYRIMYQTFRENLLEQCFSSGCNFSIPDYEMLKRLIDVDEAYASHD